MNNNTTTQPTQSSSEPDYEAIAKMLFDTFQWNLIKNALKSDYIVIGAISNLRNNPEALAAMGLVSYPTESQHFKTLNYLKQTEQQLSAEEKEKQL